jgi:hypothetical protein
MDHSFCMFAALSPALVWFLPQQSHLQYESRFATSFEAHSFLLFLESRLLSAILFLRSSQFCGCCVNAPCLPEIGTDSAKF